MFALVVAAVTALACANPTIVSARVQSATMNGALRHFTVAITIKNVGDARQPGNLLPSLDVFQNGQRVGRIGLQPLAPRASQTVRYGFDRSPDAGAGTTSLTFRLDQNGRTGNTVDCHKGRESLSISV